MGDDYNAQEAQVETERPTPAKDADKYPDRFVEIG